MKTERLNIEYTYNDIVNDNKDLEDLQNELNEVLEVADALFIEKVEEVYKNITKENYKYIGYMQGGGNRKIRRKAIKINKNKNKISKDIKMETKTLSSAPKIDLKYLTLLN